jgi:hypothetical protein
MTKRSQKSNSTRNPIAIASAQATHSVFTEFVEPAVHALIRKNRILVIFFAIAAKENVLLKKPVTRLRLQLSHA